MLLPYIISQSALVQTFNRAGRHKDLSSFRLQDSHCKVPCACEMTSRTTVPGRSGLELHTSYRIDTSCEFTEKNRRHSPVWNFHHPLKYLLVDSFIPGQRVATSKVYQISNQYFGCAMGYCLVQLLMNRIIVYRLQNIAGWLEKISQRTKTASI